MTSLPTGLAPLCTSGHRPQTPGCPLGSPAGEGGKCGADLPWPRTPRPVNGGGLHPLRPAPATAGPRPPATPHRLGLGRLMDVDFVLPKFKSDSAAQPRTQPGLNLPPACVLPAGRLRQLRRGIRAGFPEQRRSRASLSGDGSSLLFIFLPQMAFSSSRAQPPARQEAVNLANRRTKERFRIPRALPASQRERDPHSLPPPPPPGQVGASPRPETTAPASGCEGLRVTARPLPWGGRQRPQPAQGPAPLGQQPEQPLSQLRLLPCPLFSAVSRPSSPQEPGAASL